MITYCTNIHPGETWEEVFSVLSHQVIEVKNAVSAATPFPIGLRLSAQAAGEVTPEVSAKFREWLGRNNCFVPTLNGFPFSAFHKAGLKEQVYLPDWRSPDRVAYSNRLGDLLAEWLPGTMPGSVSTVPVGFRGHITRDDYPLIRDNLLGVLEHFDELRQKTGKDLMLALEPEPGCVLETADDVIAFFDYMNFPESLRTILGVCFDCCHQAISFEPPGKALEQLREADIRLGKVQISSGLRFTGPDIEQARSFDEPTYLHQVVIRAQDGSLFKYDDLPDVYKKHEFQENEEWRVHFHVPIFAPRTVSCGTTRFFLEEILPQLDPNLLLEIETYSWHVLPENDRPGSLLQSVIREITWLQEQNGA